MKQLNHLYQYINILSLDVVAGAVVCSLFFARLLGASIPFSTVGALALTVWIIYTIDHLRDALIIPATASTDRHRFHQTQFKPILLALLAAMLVDMVFIFFLPFRVLVFGVILGFVVLGYLVLQRYLKFLKEFFVAGLYTMGVLLPSLTTTHDNLHPVHLVLIGKFFITALMNLLLFSIFDYTEDRKHRQHSFVTWFGPASTRKGILFLGLFNIFIGIGLWSFDYAVALIFIAMNAMLLVILFCQRQLISNNYYRLLGDAIFFIPVFYLL